MTPSNYLSLHPRDVVTAVSKEAGTNFNNFRNIAKYSGTCSPSLANELAKASGGVMTRDEILYPEDYELSVCTNTNAVNTNK